MRFTINKKSRVRLGITKTFFSAKEKTADFSAVLSFSHTSKDDVFGKLLAIITK